MQEARHCENFISVNFFGDTFYHPYKASLEMKVHILKLRNGNFTKESGLFIASVIKRLFVGRFSYGNQLSSSKLKDEQFYISLPVYRSTKICHSKFDSSHPELYSCHTERSEVSQNLCHTEALAEVSQNQQSKKRFFADAQNDKLRDKRDKDYKIAFDYMESYIKELEQERIQELEQERIQELEAYLLVANLKDTKLNEKEKEALRIFAKLQDSDSRHCEDAVRSNLLCKDSMDCHEFDKSKFCVYDRTFQNFYNQALSQIATKELCHFERSEKSQDSNCHTEGDKPEVSHKSNNRDISLVSQAQYDNDKDISASPQYDNKDTSLFTKVQDDNFKGIKWQEFKLKELFEVKSNPQLNKDSFEFDENAEFPYFTRTCLNNGIAGYVKYLDEEHKIKGNSIAVGMLGMQFFYMQKDFYAGQFTKTIYPKFDRFNSKIAHFFIAWLNKAQKTFQGVLVRDFEKTFNESVISLPVYENSKLAFDFMESFIKSIEKAHIDNIYKFWESKMSAYHQVISAGGGGESLISFDLSEYEDFVRALASCHTEGNKPEVSQDSQNCHIEPLGEISQDSNCHTEGDKPEVSHKSNNRDISLVSQAQYDNDKDISASPQYDNKDTSLSAEAQDDNFTSISWQEFKLGELFEIANKAVLRSKADIEKDGKIPIYSSDSSNGGIIGYCNKTPSFKINEINSICAIFGDHTRAMNIAKTDFCITDNVKVLMPKFQMNENILLYIFAVWKKSIPNLGYARHWSVAKNSLISLPVYHSAKICHSKFDSSHPELYSCHTEGDKPEVSQNQQSKKRFFADAQNDKLRDKRGKDYKIAFDFMQTFIKALQKQSIEKVVEFGEVKMKAYESVITKK